MDALNGMLILDDRMHQKLQPLAPHHGVLDLKKPRTISKNLKLPSPVVTTFGAWIHGAR